MGHADSVGPSLPETVGSAVPRPPPPPERSSPPPTPGPPSSPVAVPVSGELSVARWQRVRPVRSFDAGRQSRRRRCEAGRACRGPSAHPASAPNHSWTLLEPGSRLPTQPVLRLPLHLVTVPGTLRRIAFGTAAPSTACGRTGSSSCWRTSRVAPAPVAVDPSHVVTPPVTEVTEVRVETQGSTVAVTCRWGERGRVDLPPLPTPLDRPGPHGAASSVESPSATLQRSRTIDRVPSTTQRRFDVHSATSHGQPSHPWRRTRGQSRAEGVTTVAAAMFPSPSPQEGSPLSYY